VSDETSPSSHVLSSEPPGCNTWALKFPVRTGRHAKTDPVCYNADGETAGVQAGQDRLAFFGQEMLGNEAEL
jgi:AICAR transformylase/IMP cyclohydrolase PurH